jgi:hypothetical protein
MAKGVKTGGGSRKGKPNKATATAREAISRLADESAEDFLSWVKAVAEGDKKQERTPDPEAAAKLWLAAVEYHIPKLARAEVTGANGGPMESVTKIVREIVRPKNPNG